MGRARILGAGLVGAGGILGVMYKDLENLLGWEVSAAAQQQQQPDVIGEFLKQEEKTVHTVLQPSGSSAASAKSMLFEEDSMVLKRRFGSA